MWRRNIICPVFITLTKHIGTKLIIPVSQIAWAEDFRVWLIDGQRFHVQESLDEIKHRIATASTSNCIFPEDRVVDPNYQPPTPI